MSYDLEIYGKRAAPSSMPKRVDEGDGWQVVFEAPVAVEPEDLPPYGAAVEEACSLVRIHIEGDAPEAAVASAFERAQEIARRLDGVMVDEQAGAVVDAAGTRSPLRVESPAPKNPHPRITLGWYFLDAERFRSKLIFRLLDLFEAEYPEALPRRYGPLEPPQFSWEEHARQHFHQLMKEYGYRIEWRGFAPLRRVGMSVPSRCGPHQSGYRCCYFSHEFTRKQMATKEGRERLRTLFLAVAEILHPFYAEARGSETLPSGWWWNGIPPIRGRMTYVGVPYLELWPQFRTVAEPVGRHAAVLGSMVEERRDHIGPELPPGISGPHLGPEFFDPETGDLLLWPQFRGDVLPEVFPFERPMGPAPPVLGDSEEGRGLLDD